MTRIFIGAFLPESTKKYLSHFIEDTAQTVSGIRWEIADKIHITLKFVGRVDDVTKDKILSSINDITVNTRPIPLRFSHVDAFPSFKSPRVLVVRLDNSKELTGLFKKIENELATLGIKKEKRPFIPHVTIGRIKNGFRVKGKSIQIDKNEFIIDNICVVKSELKKEGSKYINLGVYKLS